MSLQKNIDEKIQGAIARGEFDDLPGKGKPLDLDAILPRQNIREWVIQSLKNATIVPEEMELIRQIENLKKSLESSTAEIEKRALR
jgi:hypothetical protein